MRRRRRPVRPAAEMQGSAVLASGGLMARLSRDFVPAADSLSWTPKKVSKEAAPAKPPLRGALRCSNPGAAPNSLRYAPFRQRGAKSVVDARFARAPGSCASRRFRRGGPQTAHSQVRKPFGGCIRYAPFSPAEERKVLRPRAQHASRTDSARLFEQSVAARVPGGASRLEYRRKPRSEAQGRGGRGELFAYFLAAQKVGRPPGRNPGTGPATDQLQREAPPCL
jgi:hypothetical protein